MANQPPENSNPETNAGPADGQRKNVSSGVAAYNIVSDTVTGVNVRKSDNKFQAIFITVTVAILASVGAILVILNTDWKIPWYGGAMIGTLAGLIIGVILSGIYLMVYRAWRHLRGHHE